MHAGHGTFVRLNEKRRMTNGYAGEGFVILSLALPVSATRNSSGLLEWSSTDQALEALAACNHYVLRNPGKRLGTSTPRASSAYGWAGSKVLSFLLCIIWTADG